MNDTPGFQRITDWFSLKKWTPFDFQKDTWAAYNRGESGLLNAPTGSGKTYALWLAPVIEFINENPDDFLKKKNNGLQVLWISPLKALAKDIQKAQQTAVSELGLKWEVGSRTGDTAASRRIKQLKNMPEGLLITPESLHLLFTQPNHGDFFKNIKLIVVDEWHELLGTKRGVMTELAIQHIRTFKKDVRIWGISATIGNLDEARNVLLGNSFKRTVSKNSPIIRSDIHKLLKTETIIPKNTERFSFTGYLGLKMLPDMIDIVKRSNSTLIFTNTRAQTEIWYQEMLNFEPELAGQMAIHHGSLGGDVRSWVEQSLHDGKLKAVVCTSTLDLGVDFSPVETIVQIGSPKGVARALQRAGRSGHRPGETSRMYFVPSHALEMLEFAALQDAMRKKESESREPLLKPYDVLIQYLVTLAVGDGFKKEKVFKEIRKTYAFKNLHEIEFEWILNFITTGGGALFAYDEYRRVVEENGVFKVTDKPIALRHKLSIGTIMSNASLVVQFLKGGKIGTIEEQFITRLAPGDTFWFAGRSLKLVRIKDMTVYVQSDTSKTGIVPRWLGGRISLSPQLSQEIRRKIDEVAKDVFKDEEVRALEPLLKTQQRVSALPKLDELLIEKITTREGYHIFIYPFEGRSLHEGLAALLAYRISKLQPITFSIAMNDYGIELLSDTEISLENALSAGLFKTENLLEDMYASINSTEMAKRAFREVARVSGLVFQGFPGKVKMNRHLQASAEMIFEVLEQYDPGNLLIQQAFDEVLKTQVNEARLTEVLKEFQTRTIVLKTPPRLTPFAFPIFADRLREKVSSESFKDRIAKMQMQLEKYADEL
jgi:ATP-dependent Lhr-like helicase